MELYIVKPNLEISDCENCPSEQTLISKKTDYLNLQKQCKELYNLNINNKDNNNNNNKDNIPIWCIPSKNENPYKLKIQSFNLLPQDYTKSDNSSNKNILDKLSIPKLLTNFDGKWLALKFLQLNSDISLLQYKYLKSYTKITKLVKKFFSKPQISESDETEGFKQINNEMSKFKVYENLLSLLLELRKQFEKKYSHFNKQMCDDKVVNNLNININSNTNSNL